MSTLSTVENSPRALYNQCQNHLLAALPVDVLAKLDTHLELVQMSPGEILSATCGVTDHAYFPITSIVSLLYLTEKGESGEVALIGNEGFVGLPIILDGDSMPYQPVVQSAGYAYRIRASLLKQELADSEPMMKLLLRYTQALFTQIGIMAISNRHYSVEQRLCLWLLMILDRISTNELIGTHEMIANMLGVRREGISEAASRLQRAGIIRYHRGRITVLDRYRLEEKVTEDYQSVKTEYARLIPSAI
jgi:CRP-like cAMP-binding protein